VQVYETCFLEVPVSIYQATRCYNPEDHDLNNIHPWKPVNMCCRLWSLFETLLWL